MANRSVRDREFSHVKSDHLHLDFYEVEHLAVVNSHGGADHVGGDDHVSKVGLDDLGLLQRTGGYDSKITKISKAKWHGYKDCLFHNQTSKYHENY